MNFLNPIALWALAGLAVPIGIHLLSRKEGKTIRIGSIRFLTETATSKFSGIKLNEIILLAIRSVLLVTIVLFLAGFVLSSQSSSEKRLWAIVEHGLENNPQVNALLDSLAKNNYELKKLATGFPWLREEHTSTPPDYYKLTEELTTIENTEAVVIAKNRLSHFKGKRITLPTNVTWLSYPDIRASNDTTRTHKIQSSDTLTITLAYDKVYTYDKSILAASLKTLNTVSPQIIAWHEISPDQFTSTVKSDWLVWLSDAPVSFSGKILRYQPNSFNSFIHRDGKNTWFLSAPLDEATAIKNHLSIQLLDMFFGDTIDPRMAQEQDTRIAHDSEVWSKRVAPSVILKSGTQSINTLLIIAIVLLFITERVFAFYRKQ